MALSVTVASCIARARQATDLETATESTSIVTDADFVAWFNDGYRALYDVLVELAGPELFGTSATLSKPYSLPAGFYQLIGVDFGVGSAAVTLRPFRVLERNRIHSETHPRYRLRAGSLEFRPTTFAGDVTLWYIPAATTFTSGQSFDSFDGWDVFIVAYMQRQALVKMEYDPGPAERAMDEAMGRVRRSVPKIADRDRVGAGIVDVMTMSDEYYVG